MVQQRPLHHTRDLQHWLLSSCLWLISVLHPHRPRERHPLYFSLTERGVDNAVAVAQWQVRRAWAMTHWRESARLLRGNATHAAEGVHGGSLLSSGARSARDRALWGAAFRAHVRVGAQRPRMRRAVCAASFGRGRSVGGGPRRRHSR